MANGLEGADAGGGRVRTGVRLWAPFSGGHISDTHSI